MKEREREKILPKKKTSHTQQMALGVSGDGMKALIRGATAACSAVGVAVVDSCGGATC